MHYFSTDFDALNARACVGGGVNVRHVKLQAGLMSRGLMSVSPLSMVPLVPCLHGLAYHSGHKQARRPALTGRS